MFRITQTQIDASGIIDFDAAVQRYVQAMIAHQRTRGIAAPIAHPLVERCVARVLSTVPKKPDTFVAEYEVIDDRPPPPSLRELKNALLHKVQAVEVAAREAVIPPGKIPAMMLAAAKASQVLEVDRTPEQKAAIALQDSIYGRFTRLSEWSAGKMSEIEDLTDDNIAAWSIGDAV